MAGQLGLQIVDISDPTAPKLVSQYVADLQLSDVVVLGNHAYVVDGGLQILDLSDPSQPHLIGRYEGTGASSVTISGSHAWLSGYIRLGDAEVFLGGGMQVLDISNPEHPTPIGTGVVQIGNGRRVTEAQNFIYILGDDFPIIQSADTGSPATDDKPTLRILKTESSLNLSWSSLYAQYKAQQSSTVADPNSWADILTTPQPVAGNIVLPIPHTGEAKFFRLIQR